MFCCRRQWRAASSMSFHSLELCYGLQVPYSGFAMMTRVAACIGICRTIRTIAFMLTVLPSPRPGCYSRRFPPVPDTWGEYLRIGFGELRGRGGCNDLIIR
jgi:hypothetical protein